MSSMFRSTLSGGRQALKSLGGVNSMLGENMGAVQNVATAASKAKPSKKAPAKKSSATPAPPKRPPSSYALFMKHEYPLLKVSNPGLAFPEISRKLAEMWKELPRDQKTRYMNEAEKLQTASSKEKAAKKQKKKYNAYSTFVKEVYPSVRAKNLDSSFEDLSRKVAEMWKNLSEQEKETRKAKAAAAAKK